MSHIPRRRITFSSVVGLALVGVGIAAWNRPGNDGPDGARGGAESASSAVEKEPGKLPSAAEATTRPVWVRPDHGTDVHAAVATQGVRMTRQPAQIEAYEETTIFAKAAGFVSHVRVDLGSRVKAGEVLAEISIPEMEQDLAQKRALVEEAESAVGQAEAGIVAAEAGVDAAAAKAGESRAQIQPYQADVEVELSDADDRLRCGMYGSIEIMKTARVDDVRAP